MPKEYTFEDHQALAPAWEAMFGETIPYGFEIREEQVPILKECLERKSRQPLEDYVSTLSSDVLY